MIQVNPLRNHWLLLPEFRENKKFVKDYYRKIQDNKLTMLTFISHHISSCRVNSQKHKRKNLQYCIATGQNTIKT